MSNTPLKGKTAIVTGAGKGIGKAISRMLAAEGAHLMISARTRTDLETLKADILASVSPQAEVEIFTGSVADPNQVKDLIETTIQRFGRLDILINNAGVCPQFTLMHEISIDDINSTVDTNLKGPIYAMKFAIPHMVNQGGGFIVNINSVAGKMAFPYSGVYCATKFGLHALTESVSTEQQKVNNIKIIGIYPGEVFTPMWDGIEPHVKQNPDRMLDAENIAEAVRYALSQPEKALIKDVTLVPMHPPEH